MQSLLQIATQITQISIADIIHVTIISDHHIICGSYDRHHMRSEKRVARAEEQWLRYETSASHLQGSSL